MEDIVYTLTINWFEKTCGIAKDTSFAQPIYRNYLTKYIVLSLCTSGSIKLYCNKKEIILSKNELLVINDNEVIDYNKEHSPDFNRYFF